MNNIVNIENGIVSSSGFDLLNMDGSISYEDVEGHYMFITGKTEDDDLIVSSWGKKFILKLDNSDYVNVDIFEVDKHDIPDHTLLVGGFPCQDYSVARTLSQAPFQHSAHEGRQGPCQ